MDIHDYTNKVLSKLNTQPTFPKVQAIKPLALSLAQANYASEFYERLKEYIIDFEQSLNDSEEIALRLVSFGESIIIHVEDIGYSNPSLITFTGTVNTGERIQLIQHVSQLSFLVMAAKAAKPVQERERIGYKLKHEREKQPDPDATDI